MGLSKHDLTANELMVLTSELRSVEKSLGLAYLMLIGGHLGVHRFYLKRTASAIFQLLLFIAATGFYFGFYVFTVIEAMAPAMTFLVGLILTGLALFIWVLVDLFMLPGMVRQFNDQAERHLLDQIAHYRAINQRDAQ